MSTQPLLAGAVGAVLGGALLALGVARREPSGTPESGVYGPGASPAGDLSLDRDCWTDPVGMPRWCAGPGASMLGRFVLRLRRGKNAR